jgi:alpha-glutamyl/putrescinyl thymine pyrophosphorylase clade 1
MFEKPMLKILFEWIKERESIRMNRAVGKQKPWTKNPILQQYRFCNVRRMDDKVSVWLMDHWYSKHSDPHTLLIAAALARLINWPETLSYVTGGVKFDVWDMKAVLQRLLEWQSKGNKVFTGAYIINGARGGSKIIQVVENINAIHVADLKLPMIVSSSMQSTWTNLITMMGIGSFMAGQIVADLRHTRAMRNPADAATWAPMGPGSRRGMRRLMGLPARGPMNRNQFEKLLPEVIKAVHRECYDIFEDRGLEAMDIQNCLCEFDKYVRVANGEGRPRNKYDGGAQGELWT